MMADDRSIQDQNTEPADNLCLTRQSIEAVSSRFNSQFGIIVIDGVGYFQLVRQLKQKALADHYRR
jgi:hypothetical protein